MKPRKLSRNEAQEHVLRAISDFSPMSHRHYAELFGISPIAAFERIRRLWDIGTLYIERYERGRSGKPVPHYAIGGLPDADPPAPIPVIEKVRAYQATEKGKKTLARCRKRANAKHKRLMQTDEAYAEATRAYQRQWSQKKHGHKPRRRLVEVERFDPVLAALMGVKIKKGKRNASSI